MTIIAGSSQSSSLRYLETPMVANKETSSEDIAPSEVRLEEDKYGRRDSDTTIVSREDVGKLSNSRKHGKGLTEGDNEVPDLPKNNLALVMPALGLVIFLAALDQTIVATALPTIAEDLNTSPSEYSWVGTAYMLSSTVQTPFNGRVSDIIGRKPMLYAAIVIFTVFSALCGAAKSSSWLIIARAFQGLGGGSIIGLTSIVVSDIVPLEKRGAYQGILGSSWGIAAVLGPLLGGVLTEKASWRWCFYINLPTSGLALVLLMFTLKLNPSRKLTFKQLSATFDFVGLALLLISCALLIIGFSRAADYGFDTPASYGIIIAGAVVFVAAVINFLITKRNAIIPSRMFKNRTTLFFLLGSTLHAIAFLPSNYLLPQMLQGLRGDTPLESGVHLLPYALLVAWMTVVAGQINSRLRIIRPVVWTGYALAAIGFGLFYKYYTADVSYATQEGLLVIASTGIGLSLQSPMLILQAAMPLKEMAATTSAFSLTRSMGGSIGLAVFTAVLNTNLRTRFAKVPGYGTEFTVPRSASDYVALQNLPDGTMKDQVMIAFADSFRQCWIIGCAFFLGSLVLTLWTKSYSTRRSKLQAALVEGEVQEQRDLEAQAELPMNGDSTTELPLTDATQSASSLGKERSKAIAGFQKI
ncbi:hypothetical protein C362_02992 [Cryptococcus neoformans Bt1]|nr:hypothetical protein C362_02992 [Cryptococcus neoformans var. grubii Bt1]